MLSSKGSERPLWLIKQEKGPPPQGSYCLATEGALGLKQVASLGKLEEKEYKFKKGSPVRDLSLYPRYQGQAQKSEVGRVWHKLHLVSL